MNRHNAPPVVYPIGRSRFLGWLLTGGWLVGLGTALLWSGTSESPDWRTALAALSVLGAGSAAVSAWRCMPAGQLTWDGQVWHWQGAGAQDALTGQELRVAADLQHSLLMHLQSSKGAGLWLWAEKKVLPGRWLDLRRAVYSPHRRTPTLPPHDFLASEPASLRPGPLAAPSPLPAGVACPPQR